MYILGKVSRDRLLTCDQQTRTVVNHAIATSPIDFTVLEGHRVAARQRQLFAAGATKLNGVDAFSKHQGPFPLLDNPEESPSMAIDLAPWPIDWQDTRRFFMLAGVILATGNDLGIPFRWGGDWNMNGNFDDQSFFDLPHFERVDHVRAG